MLHPVFGVGHVKDPLGAIRKSRRLLAGFRVSVLSCLSGGNKGPVSGLGSYGSYDPSPPFNLHLQGNGRSLSYLEHFVLDVCF